MLCDKVVLSLAVLVSVHLCRYEPAMGFILGPVGPTERGVNSIASAEVFVTALIAGGFTHPWPEPCAVRCVDTQSAY